SEVVFHSERWRSRCISHLINGSQNLQKPEVWWGPSVRGVMELIAIVIGILVLGLATIDELRRPGARWQLDEELHEQSKVHSTPVMNFAQVENCDQRDCIEIDPPRRSSMSPMGPSGH